VTSRALHLLVRAQHAIAALRGRPLLPPGIVVGRDVFIGKGAKLDWSHGRHITIGDHATIADGARLLCHDASSRARLGATWVAPVSIGRGVFVGVDALIMPGVTIGDGAVVGAGSVVTHDVRPGIVVAGSPAVAVGSVRELDERRRLELARYAVFEEAEYTRVPLRPDAAAALCEAAKGGGYFLARCGVVEALGLNRATASHGEEE